MLDPVEKLWKLSSIQAFAYFRTEFRICPAASCPVSIVKGYGLNDLSLGLLRAGTWRTSSLSWNTPLFWADGWETSENSSTAQHCPDETGLSDFAFFNPYTVTFDFTQVLQPQRAPVLTGNFFHVNKGYFPLKCCTLPMWRSGPRGGNFPIHITFGSRISRSRDRCGSSTKWSNKYHVLTRHRFQRKLGKSPEVIVRTGCTHTNKHTHKLFWPRERV